MAAMSLEPCRGSCIPALQLVPTMFGDGQFFIRWLSVFGRPTCGEPSTSVLGPEKRRFSRFVTPDARLDAAFAERRAAWTEATRAMKPRNPSTMPPTNNVSTSSVGRVWCNVCGDATSSHTARSDSSPSILSPPLLGGPPWCTLPRAWKHSALPPSPPPRLPWPPPAVGPAADHLPVADPAEARDAGLVLAPHLWPWHVLPWC
mmetsp:Transcript_16320/g.41299  ORF Transcript_16320/g.41299 Transcript_16320/m.41299 type:complete len:203 (-) Transcript_16320:167-775(-)